MLLLCVGLAGQHMDYEPEELERKLSAEVERLSFTNFAVTFACSFIKNIDSFDNACSFSTTVTLSA